MPATDSANALPLLCIGHSHLKCVEMASAETGIAIDAINFWDQKDSVLDDPDNPILTPALQQRLRDHPGTIFSFIGGGAHAVVGLLAHPRRYDFVLPEAPALPMDPRAEILPVDAVRAILTQQMRPFLLLMRHVRTLARNKLIHLEPPPPYPDAERMLPYIPWDLFPGSLQEISPRHFRYKLWRLHSDIVAGLCAELDIGFVAHPRQAGDDEGFLRPEFFRNASHTNGEYGALLLQQMQELA